MKVLMAAHGAGCTLVLFMREECFVEIQAKTWWSIMAEFKVSRVVGLVYTITAVPGLRIETKDTLRFDWNYATGSPRY
jgi:hypothetical protein